MTFVSTSSVPKKSSVSHMTLADGRASRIIVKPTNFLEPDPGPKGPLGPEATTEAGYNFLPKRWSKCPRNSFSAPIERLLTNCCFFKLTDLLARFVASWFLVGPFILLLFFRCWCWLYLFGFLHFTQHLCCTLVFQYYSGLLLPSFARKAGQTITFPLCMFDQDILPFVARCLKAI